MSTSGTAPELCFLSACELVRLAKSGKVSAREVMAAHIAQIERVNPIVNAIVTLLDPDDLLAKASLLDESKARGENPGPLYGLPIAHKDLVPTRGIRTTFGSPLFRDFVPDHDGLIVQRLNAAGAITIGKTNTPEFGAGSQTFNSIFGKTLNPYDLTKTCGGSSGGAATALACGMLPLADGSDFGGSLRNPASFCNVVGLRPSPGRVPVWPSVVSWFPLLVEGPMARTVEDAALMLSAIAGPDPRSPIAITEPGHQFTGSLMRDWQGTRIAWSQDLGGLPVDPRVTEVLEGQRGTFELLGCELHDKEPDFTGADEVFQSWRAWFYELSFSGLLQTGRDQIKDTVVWNIEAGQQLTGPQLGQAEIKRTVLYHRVREFMEEYDFLALPVSQVPPFDVEKSFVREINGTAMESYIDWMRSCFYISVLGLPAISVPCGFTPEGLPVGLQIVGKHQDDLGVLQLAHAFQMAALTDKPRPSLAV